MYNERQTEILTQITHGLDLPADMASEVRVVQTSSCIDSVVETHDFATALMGAIGQAVAAVGERRGLGAQRVTVDRRHASLLFNEIAYFFQGGWQFDISAVHTPVNGFYQTRDDRANHEPAVPIDESELERYLVDQDSPIGLLTRVAPAVQLEKTPAFVDRAGGFPGSSTLEIGWSTGPLVPHDVPHRPTAIFRLRRARWRG